MPICQSAFTPMLILLGTAFVTTSILIYSKELCVIKSNDPITRLFDLDSLLELLCKEEEELENGISILAKEIRSELRDIAEELDEEDSKCQQNFGKLSNS